MSENDIIIRKKRKIISTAPAKFTLYQHRISNNERQKETKRGGFEERLWKFEDAKRKPQPKNLI